VRRGWLVVAPRQGLFGLSLDTSVMVELLSQMFSIDRSKVMLLGHSMGAGQVIRQANLHPDLPLAAVALGGGRDTANAERLKTIRWFVAAGKQDFGRKGALRLHHCLHAAGVESVWHEYPDVEHLMIVQAATDDVFQFLDENLRKTASSGSALNSCRLHAAKPLALTTLRCRSTQSSGPFAPRQTGLGNHPGFCP
jgi:pimeloyl-ACP methyl ester carboxylesterase